jgi:hypothetical protein
MTRRVVCSAEMVSRRHRRLGRSLAHRKFSADRSWRAEFRPATVKDIVAICVRITPYESTPPIHTHQQGRDPLRQRSAREGGTPMRRIVAIVGLTGLLVLRGVLIGGAEERWVR